YASQQRFAFAAGTQCLGWRLVEGDACMRPGRIDRLDGSTADARGLQIDEREHGAALALRDNDGKVGHVAVGHRQLLTAEDAIAQGGPQPAYVGLARAFGERQRADGGAGGKLRQPGTFLRLAATRKDGFGGEINRRGKWHRRQCRSKLLGEHAQSKMTEPNAALLLPPPTA